MRPDGWLLQGGQENSSTLSSRTTRRKLTPAVLNLVLISCRVTVCVFLPAVNTSSLFSRSTHQLVIDVNKESKMKSMRCSFVLALLCVLFEGLMHIGTVEQTEQPNYLAE
eukprot:1146038-Pelagomonas_calceolata.AAC.2